MQLQFPRKSRAPVVLATSCVVGAGCVLGTFFTLRGPDRGNTTVFTEVQRTTSPDGAIDAILAGAADVDDVNSYHVAIARKGMAMGSGKTVFVVDQVDGVEMLWRDARTLFIKSPRGRVFRQLDRIPAEDPLLSGVTIRYGRR